jgi:hypothetical protein
MARDRMVEGIERGEIRPDIDPDAQAALWFGTMRGVGQQVLLDPDAIDVRAVTEEAIEAMTRALASEGWVEAGARAGANGGTDRADR